MARNKHVRGAINARYLWYKRQRYKARKKGRCHPCANEYLWITQPILRVPIHDRNWDSCGSYNFVNVRIVSSGDWIDSLENGREYIWAIKHKII